MEHVVRLHAQTPPRSAISRVLGRHPLSDDAQPWFTGALGEREVGALLSRLPQGWSAFHAVPVGSGDADVDHLVVGPGGVFVINTKHHRGAALTVYERSVLVNGVKQPYLRNSDLEASRVRGHGGKMVTDLVSLVRFALEEETILAPFGETVDERFSRWLASHEASGNRFTPEERRWLEMIRDAVKTSLTVDEEDFDYTPFIEEGGRGRAYQVFGDRLTPLLKELNEVLVP